jgi:hypothetical protein
MSLTELLTNVRLFSVRFLLVSVLPTLALSSIILLLVLSGAPHHAPNFSTAVTRIEHLTGNQIGLLLFAAVIAGVLLYPLQFSMIQILEGYWGTARPFVLAALLATRRYDRKRRRWDKGRQGIGHGRLREAELLRVTSTYAGAVDALPRADRLMPTRLGNVLRAAEDFAGDRYGLNGVLITPRLIPQLPTGIADRLSDSRLQLDIAVRFCLIWLIATATAIALLINSGVWLWLAATTYALAWLSYRAACAAAAAYGNMLAVAIDLHRFDLLEAMHQPLPRTYREEVLRNRKLMEILSGRYIGADAELGELPRLGYRHTARKPNPTPPKEKP